VVLARLGRREKALADAEAVLKAGREPVSQYQVACIYALLGKDNPDYKTLAVHHLTAALQAPPQLRQWLALDNDLDNLRKDPEFQKVVEAVRVLHRADPAAAQR
jgi:hypothetical protein